MDEKYLPLSGIKSVLRDCLPEDEVFEMTELISAVSPAEENATEPVATYETHEEFKVYEDEEIYCIGIVFSIEDLK